MGATQASADITTMLTSIINLMNTWMPVIALIAGLIGIVLVIKSVTFLAPGRTGKAEIGKTVAFFFVGIFLFNLQSFIGSSALTFLGVNGFNPDTDSVMTYASGAAVAGSQQLYVEAGIAIVMVVGVVGLIRGLMMLTKLQENPNQFGHAVTHIVGGTFAVNFQTFIIMVGNTIGGQVKTVLQGLIQF